MLRREEVFEYKNYTNITINIRKNGALVLKKKKGNRHFWQ